MSSICFLLTIVIFFTHIHSSYYRECGRGEGEGGREGEEMVEGIEGVSEGVSEGGKLIILVILTLNC